jgi:arsenite methyltransferase
MQMLNAYQRRIVEFYTTRDNYDTDMTRDRALQHLVYAPARLGDRVLDVATGTGYVAIEAARQVGPGGHVVGLDLTPSYLEKAWVKAAQVGVNNVEWLEIDEAEFMVPSESFDRIYCSSAIVLFVDIAASLRRWYQWLKPGGMVCFSCSSVDSFFTHYILQACAEEGITLPNLHYPLGTVERCEAMLAQAGFKQPEVNLVDWGDWMALGSAQGRWNGRMWFHPEDPLPGLDEAKLGAIKGGFDRAIASALKPEGVWHEYLLFYAVGRKEA